MLKQTQNFVSFHGHVVIWFLPEIIFQVFTAFYTLRSQTLVIATNSEPSWQEVIIIFSMLDEPLLLSDNFGYTAFILLSILSTQVEKLHCTNMICHLLLILTTLTLLSSNFFRNFFSSTSFESLEIF